MSALSAADFSKPGDLCGRLGHYLQVWKQRVNIKREVVLDKEVCDKSVWQEKQPKQSFTNLLQGEGGACKCQYITKLIS